MRGGRESGFGRITRRKPQFPAKDVFSPVGVFRPEWTSDVKNGLGAASRRDGFREDQKRAAGAIRKVVANENEVLVGGRWQRAEGSAAMSRDDGSDCRGQKAGHRKQQQKKRAAYGKSAQFVPVDTDLLDKT